MTMTRRSLIVGAASLTIAAGTEALAGGEIAMQPDSRWRFFTDGVMGGVSTGGVEFLSEDGTRFARLTGHVSTANRGGFIQIRRDLILQMFDTAMAPLRQAEPFDFGRSDLVERLRDMGLAMGAERDLTHVPPPATLFLHRKIGGIYLLAARLGARVALRPLLERHRLDAQAVIRG